MSILGEISHDTDDDNNNDGEDVNVVVGPNSIGGKETQMYVDGGIQRDVIINGSNGCMKLTMPTLDVGVGAALSFEDYNPPEQRTRLDRSTDGYIKSSRRRDDQQREIASSVMAMTNRTHRTCFDDDSADTESMTAASINSRTLFNGAWCQWRRPPGHDDERWRLDW